MSQIFAYNLSKFKKSRIWLAWPACLQDLGPRILLAQSNCVAGPGSGLTGAAGVSSRVGGKEVAHVVGKSVPYKENENMSGGAEGDGRQASHYYRKK